MSGAQGDVGVPTPGSEVSTGGAYDLTEIDHVAIAVFDLASAIAWYEKALGAKVAHRARVESEGIEEALLGVAQSYVQLLAPIRDDSPVSKFLATRGEGIHHVAYRVRDCEAAIQRMKDAGATAIDDAPRSGARGTRIAFIHPRSAFGTLIELVEEPTSPS